MPNYFEFGQGKQFRKGSMSFNDFFFCQVELFGQFCRGIIRNSCVKLF